MNAQEIMKANIKRFLKARGLLQKDLAFWCGKKTESWISHLLNSKTPIPPRYYDKIADFFGYAVYQLFLPSTIADRRALLPDRRRGQERRMPGKRTAPEA